MGENKPQPKDPHDIAWDGNASDAPIAEDIVIAKDGGLSNETHTSDLDTRKLTITSFKNHSAQEKREVHLTLPQLADFIRTRTASRKDALPWLKLAIFGDLRTPLRASADGKMTGNSLRSNVNVLEVTGTEAENDAKTDEKIVPFDTALEIIRKAGIRALLYTSPSYVPVTNERWRVLVPFSKNYPPEFRVKMTARINGLFDRRIEGESFTLSQSYLYGHVKDNPHHRVEVLDGDFLDLRDDLYAGSIFKDGSRIGDGKPHDETVDSVDDDDGELTPHLIEYLDMDDLGKNKPHGKYEGRSKLLFGFLTACAHARVNGQLVQAACLDPKYSGKAIYQHCLEKGGIDYVLRQMAEARKKVVIDERPRVVVRGGQLHTLATRCEQILLEAKVQIYERSNELVRPIVNEVDASHGRRTKTAELTAVELVYLRDILSRYAAFFSYNVALDRLTPCNPPSEVVATVLARAGEFPFPHLAGIITTPTMRPDGSLLIEAEYDPATKLLLVSPPELPPIPDKPTKEQAIEAMTLLEGLLVEFPLVGEVDKSVALSGFITPVVRGAFMVAPMHASKSPVAGSGKSTLWDTAAAIAIGQYMPVRAAGRTEEETEKRLNTALMAGHPLISIDNVNGELGGDALCQTVERPILMLRILGRSEELRIDNRFTLYCTGNNIALKGDMTRRVLTAILDPEMERPELREFRGDPVATVLADRGKYIAACLTICRAYLVAGRQGKVKPLASYAGWSDTVRSALIWLGKADPVLSIEDARDDDPILIELREMLQAWVEVFGTGSLFSMTQQELIQRINQTDPETRELRWPRLHAAAKTVAVSRQGGVDSKRLGYWTRRNKGRIVDGLRLKAKLNRDKGVNEWWIERNAGLPPITGQYQPVAAPARQPATGSTRRAEDDDIIPF